MLSVVTNTNTIVVLLLNSLILSVASSLLFTATF